MPKYYSAELINFQQKKNIHEAKHKCMQNEIIELGGYFIGMYGRTVNYKMTIHEYSLCS